MIKDRISNFIIKLSPQHIFTRLCTKILHNGTPVSTYMTAIEN